MDFRSDLYSLTLVGYEMRIGENPFTADNIPTVLNRIINLKHMGVHQVRPEVPEQLSSLVVKFMVRNSEETFQSGKDILPEL